MRIATIKTELNGDPSRYSALSNRAAADDMNVKNRIRVKKSMSGDEIFQQTDSAQFSALSATKQQMWVSFCARDIVDPSSSANISFVKFIFGSGGATVVSLNSARNERISRGEQLGWGRVTESDVQDARAI